MLFDSMLMVKRGHTLYWSHFRWSTFNAPFGWEESCWMEWNGNLYFFRRNICKFHLLLFNPSLPIQPRAQTRLFENVWSIMLPIHFFHNPSSLFSLHSSIFHLQFFMYLFILFLHKLGIRSIMLPISFFSTKTEHNYYGSEVGLKLGTFFLVIYINWHV